MSGRVYPEDQGPAPESNIREQGHHTRNVNAGHEQASYKTIRTSNSRDGRPNNGKPKRKSMGFVLWRRGWGRGNRSCYRILRDPTQYPRDCCIPKLRAEMGTSQYVQLYHAGDSQRTPNQLHQLFKTARRVFPEGGIRYQYDIIATVDRTLSPDLELLKKQRKEVNAAELHRTAAIPNPFLKMAHHDDIRKRQYELELLMHTYKSMEEHTSKDYCAAKVFQSERVKRLCWGRPVRTVRRPTLSQDPYYDDEVPEGFDFMLLLCDPSTGPEFIRNSNLGFRQFTGYGGLRNIPQYDHTTELLVHPLREAGQLGKRSGLRRQ